VSDDTDPNTNASQKMFEKYADEDRDFVHTKRIITPFGTSSFEIYFEFK